MRTWYCLFEWLVMPFGLTNAPATLWRWCKVSYTLRLTNFVLVYLDDILIHSWTILEPVGQVLEVLKTHHFSAKVSKSEFEVSISLSIRIVTHLSSAAFLLNIARQFGWALIPSITIRLDCYALATWSTVTCGVSLMLPVYFYASLRFCIFMDVQSYQKVF